MACPRADAASWSAGSPFAPRVALRWPLAVSVALRLLCDGGEYRADVVPTTQQERSGLAGQRVGDLIRNFDSDSRHGPPRSCDAPRAWAAALGAINGN